MQDDVIGTIFPMRLLKVGHGTREERKREPMKKKEEYEMEEETDNINPVRL